LVFADLFEVFIGHLFNDTSDENSLGQLRWVK